MVSGYLDSVPIFLEGFFGLSPAACGSLVAVLGLSLAPCSIALGRLSSKVSDRRCIPHPRALAVWMVLDLALCVCLRNTACWCCWMMLLKVVGVALSLHCNRLGV